MSTTLYTGGRIFTSASPAWAEAIVVHDETIGYVGSAAGAIAYAAMDSDGIDSDATVIDLAGQTVLPGFTDAHTHLVMMGEALGQVGLADAGSLPEIQDRLRAARRANPLLPRIRGRGWLFDDVPGTPTAQMLDAAVSDVPVYLDANDYHSCWVNSAALVELGISRDSPDPFNGRIGRDADGQPNGMLYETAAHLRAWEFLAAQATDAERDVAVERTIDAYLSAGVTGVIDMAFDELALAAFLRAADRRGGSLPIRVVAHWLVENLGDETANLRQVERAIDLARSIESPWIRIAGIKLGIDGVIDSCTATMRHDYTNGTNGDPIWPFEHLAPVVVAADAAGLQIAMHAIGDGAVELALDGIEHAIAVNGERQHRHRIEHLEYATGVDIDRLARLGVTASMQPVHCDPAILGNWASLLGPERAARGFAWTEFIQHGALLAFSTDAPTAPHDAFNNLYAAVTRRSSTEPSLPAYHPEYAVPRGDAIIHATRDSAASCFDDRVRGSLVAGLAADFVVLDRDPFSGDADELLSTRVIRTVVAGRTVYEDQREESRR